MRQLVTFAPVRAVGRPVRFSAVRFPLSFSPMGLLLLLRCLLGSCPSLAVNFPAVGACPCLLLLGLALFQTVTFLILSFTLCPAGPASGYVKGAASRRRLARGSGGLSWRLGVEVEGEWLQHPSGSPQTCRVPSVHRYKWFWGWVRGFLFPPFCSSSSRQETGQDRMVSGLWLWLWVACFVENPLHRAENGRRWVQSHSAPRGGRGPRRKTREQKERRRKKI